MTTEFYALTIVALEFSYLRIFLRSGRSFLYGSILVNLILVSIFGGQLMSIFGLVTNLGNVFYVSIAFTMYILFEQYGLNKARQAIWSSALLLVMFTILSQLSVARIGITQTIDLENALKLVFNISPRIAVASMLAFLLAQHFNLYVYEYLFKNKPRLGMWTRSNISNLLTQVVDSTLFFLVAFYGTLSLPEISEIMFVGFALKVVIGLLASPILFSTPILVKQS